MMSWSRVVLSLLLLGQATAFLAPVSTRRQVQQTHPARLVVVRSSTEEEADTASPGTPDKQLSRKERTREAVSRLLKDLEDDDEPSKKKTKREAVSEARKMSAKVKLEPEVTFFEGPPSWTEVILPTVSILTVIGIIPFAASVARQVWVRYKITSRRISVTSGVGGKDLTEVIYADVEKMAFAFRLFGATGDLVLTLRDGAKLEMRSLPNFPEIYNYIRDQLDEDAQQNSQTLPPP